LTMSVLLSGMGGSYQHTPSVHSVHAEDWGHIDSDRVSQKSGPYDISYRNNDVNSYRLGKNSFAIRPTKSAHRANRSKCGLPRTQSEVVSYSDTASTKETVTTAAMASPVLHSPTLLSTSVHNHSKTHIVSSSNHSNHGKRGSIDGSNHGNNGNHGSQRGSIIDSKQLQQTLKAVQSWHSNSPKPEILNTREQTIGIARPESKELVQVTSYKPRSEPVASNQKANFTGSYVDKILQNTAKRHSVPRDPTGHVPEVPAMVQQRRHRSLGSLQSKEGYNRRVVTKPEKKMKQNRSLRHLTSN